MSQEIIEQWLTNVSDSVKQLDLEAHMALVSSKVQVYGLPSGKVVNYQQWQKRRHNEFSQQQLLRLAYTLLNIKTIAQRRLIFRVEENMEASSGVTLQVTKDIILELEEDNVWRVVEEKIHHWKTS